MNIDQSIEQENELYWKTYIFAENIRYDPSARQVYATLALGHAIRWAALVDLRASGVAEVEGVSR